MDGHLITARSLISVISSLNQMYKFHNKEDNSQGLWNLETMTAVRLKKGVRDIHLYYGDLSASVVVSFSIV